MTETVTDTDTVTENPQNQFPTPDPTLNALEPLVGTWDMTGKDLNSGDPLGGRLVFEWMEGGFFLVQQHEMDHGHGTMKGVEYIGYEADSGTLRSRYFDSTGNAFTYVWKLQDGELSIWFGEEGSPAGFTGTFSADGATISGRWAWPGGGYEATMTKVS
ncbi:DUF1579 family protein [Nonomuraea gerenzanensis]|uniref:DUF1579 domain-containing protein n=1 Tax=Nonomuraea gerenzanensis TaxID=93944 RepID=A0A1M4EAP5_9ACTN|nr:DUF1579 family protein [Nonomuraea gerenzanensis]UBU18027.1 DUF1579 domain-containing protein [Nonomuraea gerenzanensis]SBO95832.1 hypothetical protein BN4615_P5348 [Nonomuraea gerenzanensis]